MNPNIAASREPSPSPVLGILSLGLGIIGIILMVPTLLILFCGVAPIITGIAAVIFGFLGLSRAKRDPVHYGGRGLAIGGVVAGVLAIIAPILWTVFSFGLYFLMRAAR